MGEVDQDRSRSSTVFRIAIAIHGSGAQGRRVELGERAILDFAEFYGIAIAVVAIAFPTIVYAGERMATSSPPAQSSTVPKRVAQKTRQVAARIPWILRESVWRDCPRFVEVQQWRSS